jgi:hypothetical protein
LDVTKGRLVSISINNQQDATFLLIESVSYCGSYGVATLAVVAVYLGVYVVGR